MASDSIRLFFALWPGDALRHQLHELSSDIKKQQQGRGRTVPESNLHITLSFLGNVPADKLNCIKTAADNVQGSAFSLKLVEVIFRKRQQMAWCMPEDTPEVLKQLVADLNEQLAICDIPLEKRAYLAHMTLMRKLVSRDWDDDFLVIQPGQVVRPTHDDRVVDC